MRSEQTGAEDPRIEASTFAPQDGTAFRSAKTDGFELFIGTFLGRSGGGGGGDDGIRGRWSKDGGQRHRCPVLGDILSETHTVRGVERAAYTYILAVGLIPLVDNGQTSI